MNATNSDPFHDESKQLAASEVIEPTSIEHEELLVISNTTSNST
jgi:hypothetical protein